MDSELKVKVCGMREADNIREVAALGIDYMGMIFWSHSPRCFPSGNPQFPTFNAQQLKTVGVFVDEQPEVIANRVESFGLDVIQLHGHEAPQTIERLRHALPHVQIWKAVSISSADSVVAYKDYEACVDAFVFDTKCKTVGGSGQQFDWSVLQAYDGQQPFLLSGGIGPDDAERILAFHHPRCIGIDLNSRFEVSAGIKDVAALSRFLNRIQHQKSKRHE